MPALPRPAHGPLSRRSVIGLGVAGLGAGLGALAGCSSGTTSTGTQRARPASVTPDVQTAAVALAAVRSAHDAVRATARRFPATRASLAGLEVMHTAHERSLVDAVPAQERGSTTPAPYAVAARKDVAVARLQAAEARLHDTLQALALRAQSGEFARLLASMAAAVTVHRQALGSGA